MEDVYICSTLCRPNATTKWMQLFKWVCCHLP